MLLNIPNYTNLEQLGEGAFGVVYKARYSDGKTVAIKVPKNEEAVNHLAKEGKLTLETKLDHPNIVKVHEANLTHSPPYIIMEYVEGESLEERLDRGVVSSAEALHIVKQVLNALFHTHSQNVVHGDIKPSNILISRGRDVKVSDFIVGKIKKDSRYRAQYGGIGDMRYESPQSKFSTPNFSDDIFSLGVVWYEMLTGELPEVKLVGERYKVLYQIEIPELQISRAEKRILSKMLKSDSRKRYADVNSILNLITPIQDKKNILDGFLQMYNKGRKALQNFSNAFRIRGESKTYIQTEVRIPKAKTTPVSSLLELKRKPLELSLYDKYLDKEINFSRYLKVAALVSFLAIGGFFGVKGIGRVLNSLSLEQRVESRVESRSLPSRLGGQKQLGVPSISNKPHNNSESSQTINYTRLEDFTINLNLGIRGIQDNIEFTLENGTRKIRVKDSEGWIFDVIEHNQDNIIDKIYENIEAETGNPDLSIKGYYFKRGDDDKLIKPNGNINLSTELDWSDFQRVFNEVHSYMEKNNLYRNPQKIKRNEQQSSQRTSSPDNKTVNHENKLPSLINGERERQLETGSDLANNRTFMMEVVERFLRRNNYKFVKNMNLGIYNYVYNIEGIGAYEIDLNNKVKPDFIVTAKNGDIFAIEDHFLEDPIKMKYYHKDEGPVRKRKDGFYTATGFPVVRIPITSSESQLEEFLGRNIPSSTDWIRVSPEKEPFSDGKYIYVKSLSRSSKLVTDKQEASKQADVLQETDHPQPVVSVERALENSLYRVLDAYESQGLLSYQRGVRNDVDADARVKIGDMTVLFDVESNYDRMVAKSKAIKSGGKYNGFWPPNYVRRDGSLDESAFKKALMPRLTPYLNRL